MLGHHVNLIKHMTVAFSQVRMHGAHELNTPPLAHAILTTRKLVTALTECCGAI